MQLSAQADAEDRLPLLDDRSMQRCDQPARGEIGHPVAERADAGKNQVGCRALDVAAIVARRDPSKPSFLDRARHRSEVAEPVVDDDDHQRSCGLLRERSWR